MKKRKISLCLVIFAFFIGSAVLAQTIDQIQKTEKDIQKEKQLREKIEKEKPKPKIEEKLPAKEPTPVSQEKTLVKSITVVGVALLSEKEIFDIVSPFKNKELTVQEMQKVADLITDAYRQKGFVTSRAYLPPQKIVEGVLEIRALEGITGDIDIKGNRYFSTTLLRDKIALEKGEPFNYELLRRGLSNINEHSDRSAKAVLMPGKEPSTTDVSVEVKDRLPLHVGLDWDNFGSRYVDENRYRTTISHNNLFGWDDSVSLQYQIAEAENYTLLSLRYLLPLNESLKLGFITSDSKVKLGKENEDTPVRGKSRLYSIFVIQSLIEKENAAVDFNLGFDYKDVYNFQANVESSRDRLRIVRVGVDSDLTDKFGRTLFNHEIGFGVPDIMAALDSKDPKASRSGSGGKFTKYTMYLLRLHKMPWESTLLWKNQFQITGNALTSSEQFQLGGFANVRGYPPAESVGDRGYAMTWEWSFPIYFIGKDLRVPFYNEAKLYDAVRFDFLYDWANVHLKNPGAGEEKNETLRSAGFGIRINLPGDFSMRFDFCWPTDRKPSDQKQFHPWTQISKRF